MDLRERFERDATGGNFTGRFESGEYYSPATQDRWEGYQAGHAAAAAEIAELRAKVGKLQQFATLVRSGLANGAIRSQPIMTFDDDSPGAEFTSLGEECNKAIDAARDK